MDIGTIIISDNDERYIVTKMENGEVTNKERLEDYVARNVAVPIGYGKRTIKEILDHYCNGYLHENEVVHTKEPLRLQYNEMGSLEQISTMLWNLMMDEVEKNGHSDLTLAIEGASRSIREIIELNNIVE